MYFETLAKPLKSSRRPEAATCGVLLESVLKALQNSEQNTCAIESLFL